MTDERIQMCPSCGHMAHVAGECPSELTGPYAECDCGYEPAPPKAAPSTDEGEARGAYKWAQLRGVGLWVYSLDEGAHWRQVIIPPVVEAAIRAPLEERIRELEARAQVAESNQDFLARAFDAGGQFERLQDEVERLREALRRIRAHTMTGEQITGDVRCWFLADEALATPPSSTEGTDYWCGHDAHVPGDCPWAGTKEGGE